MAFISVCPRRATDHSAGPGVIKRRTEQQDAWPCAVLLYYPFIAAAQRKARQFGPAIPGWGQRLITDSSSTPR